MQMNDITIKGADGSTNITYTGVVPSAGDKSPAVWRANGLGGSIGQRPELRLKSFANGNSQLRKLEASFSYPSTFTDASTGRVSVAERLNYTLTVAVPVTMPDATLVEAVAQGMNLLASTLFKDSISSGYAPS